MANQFCSQCGTKLLSDARFCAQCGQSIHAGATARRAPIRFDRYAPLFVVGAVLAVVGVTVLLGSRSAPPPNAPPPLAAPPGATGGNAGAMPEGHPPVSVPDDVRQVITRLADAAKSKPDDVDTWLQLGFVQYRAGQVEPAYLADAHVTYTHILEKQPENLDALRALGNIAYDRNEPQQALELYQQYLKLKPDDLGVQTDVGTMLLSTEKVDAARETYEKVLAVDPKFFQAQFNLAIAYRAGGDSQKAVAALERARDIAPDDATKQRVNDVLARVTGVPAPGGAAAPPGGKPPGAGGAMPSSDLHDDVEAMFRSHPIVAPKLDRVEWPEEQHARVLLRDFPMETMPPFAREKFIDRIRTTVRDSKSRHQVTVAVQIELVDNATGKVMETVSE